MDYTLCLLFTLLESPLNAWDCFKNALAYNLSRGRQNYSPGMLLHFPWAYHLAFI